LIMDEHRAASSRWPTILLIVGAGVVSACQVGKATVALGAIQSDLAVSLAVVSWLLSAFAIVGALAGVAIGLAVDHIGARRMAVGGLLLQGICSAIGALSAGAPMLLATRVLEGFGFLAVTVAAPALIVQAAPQRVRDRAFAVWATFMPVGIAGVLLAAPLLGVIGWRGFWTLNAVLLVGYAVLVGLGTPSRPADATARRSISDDVRAISVAGGPWLLAGLFAAFSACFFAVFGFLPYLLADRLAVSAEIGSTLTALAVLASAGGNLVCGQLLAQGLRPWRILLTSFCLLALCGLGIFQATVPGGFAYGLCVVFSFVSGFIPVVLIDGAPRHAPRPELVGAAMGFVMQGNNVGLVLGPALAGATAGAAGWPAVSFLVVGMAGIAILLGLLFRARPAEQALAS
jgi:MFS transporter, DHA1 family, inner membrane transport protein